MGTLCWRKGDFAVRLNDDGSFDKVILDGAEAGHARVQVPTSNIPALVDPACLFPDRVLTDQNTLAMAFAELSKRMLLAQAARLTSRRASETNTSIYRDEQSDGRVIAIRMGGSREACFNPAGLIFRIEWDVYKRNPDSFAWNILLQKPNRDEFLKFFTRFEALFPAGDVQIWGAEFGSEVE